MKTTRARRPQPAIREQKSEENLQAATRAKRVRSKDASDNWHSGPRDETAGSGRTTAKTGAKPAGVGRAPKSGGSRIHAGMPATDKPAAKAAGARIRNATTARPANTRPPTAAAAAGTTPEQEGISKPRKPRGTVAKAKKLAVRHGSAKQVEQQKQLRAKRLTPDQVGEERLQKALAFSGWGSRREAETWVSEGRVSVNGKIAELGTKVKQGDDVRVDGKRVSLRWPDRLPRIVMYHKQEGELVTRDDPQGRVTVFERLPKLASSKWVAIGRLDFNTSGLLLFTTSGDLANRMTHPSFEVEREYAARVMGELTGEQMKTMTAGIELDDGPAHFDHISDSGGEGKNRWYRVVLKEGRNREVRRMFEHFEIPVSRLMRVRFGMFVLPARLKRGQFYELNETEVLTALKWADLRLNGVAKEF
ncbi:23S rRNA pseudouridine(2605) synthase RluB [Silvimonas sp.]|uniref:23S rRNA pseudouridine(2605) synthase RluB n=1 Tax=Silvimonas sp. TaxID=2650811 RepID=UPI00284CFE02|nr:pseudouridine synthase [Silvimonas sp.]MDR3428654.1 pseudouridine synthase [Silvimonas sp.]